MLRYMRPYLLLALPLPIAGGAAYGAGAIGVLGAYAFTAAGLLVAGVGYARWEERQHTHHDR